MQVPTTPTGRTADVRSGRRGLRPIDAPPRRGAARVRTGRVPLVLVLVLALATAAASCSIVTQNSPSEEDLGGIDLGQATTSTTVPTTVADAVVTLPPGFVLPDTRTVQLPPVLGRNQGQVDHSQPRLPVRGGGATLRGTVFGPDGPVEGAVVRLERFVGDDFGREDIATNRDGRWEASGLMGGRYKVRAWKRPDLATVEPQAAFVANDKGEATVDLTMQKFEGEQLQGALDEAAPAVGQIHDLKVLVTRNEVDDNGIVVGVGIEAREVEIVLLGGVRVAGEKKTTTDADGNATFRVICTATGVNGVTLVSGDLRTDVDLPDCAEGTFDADTAPPELPDFPVGTTLIVPSAGPYPAGTYTAVGPGACGTAFQEYVGDRWASNLTLDRTFSVANPIRNLAVAPNHPACTFRRTA